MPVDKMKALVKTGKGPGLVEVRDVPIPSIGDNEVLIEVKAAGICGTDLHIYHDRFPYWPPVILGHEFAGLIVAAGKQVTGWKVGDRVVGEPHTLACGKCWLCRTGNRQLCAEKRSPGWGIDGCFARFMRFPGPALLHRIPDGMSFEEAALVEPLANVVSDVLERGGVEASDRVVVVGPGPVGLLAAMVAKASGAGKVVMLGTDADEKIRLPAARRIKEIDLVLNVDREDAVKQTMEWTEGRGADLVIEASGSEKGISQSLALVRKLGRMAAIGLTGKAEIPFPYDSGMFKAATLFFNLSTTSSSWEKAISLIAEKKIDVLPLITHRGGLDRWQEIFQALENKKGIKGIFIP
ncbi:MAG: alcohol dehydrogenase catalytic domain-containing protein [Acidobacteriota bacterium]